MEIEFFGAAGEVTGSCHILRAGGRQILLDCGLIQGRRREEERNADAFPFEAADIDAVILSHSHIDHSGRLPLLVRRGFRGPIYAHNATADLCEILLLDSASLAERDAEYENRRREQRGKPPVSPLYDRDDARAALRYFRGQRYRTRFELFPGIEARFQDAGHIMGSTSVEVWLSENGETRKVVFSGDLGQYDTPILQDPAALQDADVVIMESTYGDHNHRNRQDTWDELGGIIRETRGRGNILMPAFAIGRSQEVLYALGKNYVDWGLADWHVFLDSPMAIEASEVYWDYPHLYDDEATKFRKSVFDMPRLGNLHLTRSSEESMVINRLTQGGIIIAGSGMCTGGRIVHHLKHNLPRNHCRVTILGYQANGTLGRQLVDGERQVRIHGEDIPVRATIHTLGGLSAHAGQDDLVRWVSSIRGVRQLFLVHGDRDAATALGDRLSRSGMDDVVLPRPGLRVNLSGG